ncbi:MAG: fimbrial assembly protein [Proteobacteria bacterium]|nr:fimbrial assembly protein [Pseudomonadota bacterium]
MKRPRTCRRQAGVALLEALVSILLFSIGVLGVVALQAKASQFSVDSEDRSRAALLANQIVSQMWAQQSTSVDTSSWQTQVSSSSRGLPSGNGSVSVDSTGLATVTITWKAPWRKSAEQANSYVTKVIIP